MKRDGKEGKVGKWRWSVESNGGCVWAVDVMA